MDSKTLDAQLLADYHELGARRMQVVLLRRALLRHGRHDDLCTDGACRCGLREAMLIGADARQACGLPEDINAEHVCENCGRDWRGLNECPVCGHVTEAK